MTKETIRKGKEKTHTPEFKAKVGHEKISRGRQHQHSAFVKIFPQTRQNGSLVCNTNIWSNSGHLPLPCRAKERKAEDFEHDR
jgi:hypothetical protein